MATIPEMLAAVHRLHNLPPEIGIWDNARGNDYQQRDEDLKLAAELALTEHPADEDVKIDKAWIASRWPRDKRFGAYRLSLMVFLGATGGHWMAYTCANPRIPGIPIDCRMKTRGDLYSLELALGITPQPSC